MERNDNACSKSEWCSNCRTAEDLNDGLEQARNVDNHSESGSGQTNKECSNVITVSRFHSNFLAGKADENDCTVAQVPSFSLFHRPSFQFVMEDLKALSA